MIAVCPAASLGASWDLTQPASTQSIFSAAAFPDGTAYVLDPNAPLADPRIGGQTLWASSDFGATWTQRPAQPFAYTAFLSFATPTLGFAAHNGDVLRTTDGGRSWDSAAPLPAPDGERVGITAIDTAAQGALVAAGGRAAAPGQCGDVESIYTSTDHGETWRATPLPGGELLSTREVRFLDVQHGAVVAFDTDEPCGEGTNTVVLVTDDGGAHFHKVFDCHGICTSVAMVTPDVILAGYNDGRIARSTDAGATFAVARLVPEDPRDNAGAAFWVDGLEFADDRVGYASTDGRGLWRTADGGATWTLEDSLRSTLYGPGIGALAVADAQHAVYAGAPGIFTGIP